MRRMCAVAALVAASVAACGRGDGATAGGARSACEEFVKQQAAPASDLLTVHLNVHLSSVDVREQTKGHWTVTGQLKAVSSDNTAEAGGSFSCSTHRDGDWVNDGVTLS